MIQVSQSAITLRTRSTSAVAMLQQLSGSEPAAAQDAELLSANPPLGAQQEPERNEKCMISSRRERCAHRGGLVS
jgi:hypothetical protein